MPTKKVYLEPDKYYHIYNHANGFEDIFKNDEDKIIFINKLKEYILPIADIFSYCLMQNHFHLLLRIKQLDDILNLERFNYLIAKKQNMTHNIFNELINKKISSLFGHFFNSYAQSFNFKYNRIGSLFMKNFGRKLVNKEKYLIT